ncbi:hypothetical protein [Consotaella aegiceratis]|uniref:hypothetical protein n=1 Tax=Consotaella aegiceratis TaxID=3097961 RepID=UPI002F42FB0B
MTRLKIIEGRRRPDPRKRAIVPAYFVTTGVEVISVHETREEAEAALAELRAKHVPERRVYGNGKSGNGSTFDEIIAAFPGYTEGGEE